MGVDLSGAQTRKSLFEPASKQVVAVAFVTSASHDNQIRMSPELGWRRVDVRAIAVTIALVGVFGLCQGLSYPLLSLILERQGVDPALIGLNAAMMPAGILASGLLLPAATRRFGSAAVAIASLVLQAVLLVLIGAWRDLWLWFPARFLLGCAISGVYVTSETWINTLTPARIRGRVLGLFASSLSLGFALGPLVLIGTGVDDWRPFGAAVAITLAGALLLLTVFNHFPATKTASQNSTSRFLAQAPFLLLLVFIVAAYDQAFLALYPVYGTATGFKEQDVSSAITVWAAGNIVLQMPIGWLADHWSRRGTLILLCFATFAGALVLPYAQTSPHLLWPLLFVWGPASYGVYLLALLELGQRFSGSSLMAGNAAFAVMWGFGGLAGPTIVGFAMHPLGVNGLPWTLASIYGVLLVAAFLRPGLPDIVVKEQPTGRKQAS